tara:strand:- start:3091 stop:3336 length:246 start_codon:yes stop_codon:yes gene_type:complete
MIGLPIRLDVLQADESLTFLGLPDDRTEILELLVRNIGHLYESLIVKTKNRYIDKTLSKLFLLDNHRKEHQILRTQFIILY